jgi:hypothetical protein
VWLFFNRKGLLVLFQCFYYNLTNSFLYIGIKESEIIKGTVLFSLFRMGNVSGPVKSRENVEIVHKIFLKENEPWFYRYGEHHNFNGLSTFDSLGSITKDGKNVWYGRFYSLCDTSTDVELFQVPTGWRANTFRTRAGVFPQRPQ